MARSHREIFSFVVTIIVLYIGVVDSQNCQTGQYVKICSGEQSGRKVRLSGLDGMKGMGCSCNLKFSKATGEGAVIGVSNRTITGHCDYYLAFRHKMDEVEKVLYSCDLQTTIWHELFLRKEEQLTLYLKKGTENMKGFKFCLDLDVPVGYSIKLQCTSTSTTTTSSTAYSPYMESSRTINVISAMSSTRSIDDTHSTLLNSKTGENDGTSYGTVTSNKRSVLSLTSTPQPANDDSDWLIGIIIGSILAVLVVVASVIIIVCLVTRRKKKPQYETPLEPQDRPHSHVNTAVTPNSNASTYDNRNTQVGNQGMIYLENDVYKSTDDDVPVGRKGGNHEGMIYLVNDLYISSNETDNVHQDAESSVPHQPVEYAVVNKTAKKSSSGNGASTGHTVGPHGDEYTLVQKK